MSVETIQEEKPHPSEEVEEAREAARESFGVPVYTCVLITCIVAVTLIQFYAGLEASVDAAGFDKPQFAAGEYWRILTGAALHGGVMHIFFNSYAFYSFGRLFEFLSNRAHLAIAFLLSAVAGGVLSFIFKPDGTSVGASGGILGIVGYLTVYAFRRRQFVSREFRKSLLMNIGFILLFGLVLYQVVDNYGHIGGLVCGAVYGFLQIPTDPYRDPREAGKVAETAGLVAMGVFIAVSIFSIYLILTFGS
ncbi:MAG: rhomboid family intramembrane serine protease [Chloracidobacterium sp.]|nr:rhomboid family intramembrane serine protease [Chloracidobacterium sp.]